MLIYETVIGQFFFDEDAITSNSFSDMFEDFTHLLLNKNNIIL
jgi:hypothetical protein